MMTKEFQNLLALFASQDKINNNLAIVMAENYQEEFQLYFKCSSKEYIELYFLNTQLGLKWSMTEFPETSNNIPGILNAIKLSLKSD